MIDSAKSKKNSSSFIFVPASLLMLAIVIGITLFLYIQNKQNSTTKQSDISQGVAQQNKKRSIYPEIIALPTLTAKGLNEKYPDVVCRRFTDINEALQAAPIACDLDLAGKGINALPNEITKLTKLKTLDLSKNNFTEIPNILTELKELVLINLSNNKLTTVPDVLGLKNLQILILTGNQIANKPTVAQTSSTLTPPSSPSMIKITY